MTIARVAGLLALALAAANPAWAQLGTSNNPPPQNLFHFNDTPQRLNNGLGTMAERRARLAQLKRQQVRHQAPATR